MLTTDFKNEDRIILHVGHRLTVNTKSGIYLTINFRLNIQSLSKLHCKNWGVKKLMTPVGVQFRGPHPRVLKLHPRV